MSVDIDHNKTLPNRWAGLAFHHQTDSLAGWLTDCIHSLDPSIPICVNHLDKEPQNGDGRMWIGVIEPGKCGKSPRSRQQCFIVC